MCEVTRQKIEQDVAKFLESGGSIQQIPTGASANLETGERRSQGEIRAGIKRACQRKYYNNQNQSAQITESSP